ncbi:MAG: radical SAM protein [Candidatus Dojkabacteria bacterium]|nr:radical SAM protein [Candidatus Dojkabacteria bacterium]
MYLSFEEIKEVHLEITSKCNLLCPSCARTITFYDEGYLQKHSDKKNIDITISDIKKIFSVKFIDNLECVMFCGNYSEPIANNDILEILEYFKINKNIKIILFTNGSLRNKDFWKSLSRFFSDERSGVIFSIDGLSDTNKIYRINSNFEKIMENAKTFIENGGYAVWDFLVFEHNKHQIEEAEKLAKKIGFKQIRFKQSHRLISKNLQKSNIFKYKENIEKIKTVKIVDDYEEKMKKIEKIYGSYENYKKNCPVNCKTRNRKSIYIDFLQRVWPCCWFAANFMHHDNVETEELEKLYCYYDNDYDFNSLKKKSLEEILNHDFFVNYLEKSWMDKNFRHSVCGKVCGNIVEFSSNDKTNRKVKVL